MFRKEPRTVYLSFPCNEVGRFTLGLDFIIVEVFWFLPVEASDYIAKKMYALRKGLNISDIMVLTPKEYKDSYEMKRCLDWQ